MTRISTRTRHTIKGRLVVAIFLVGCVPRLIGLALATMARIRSLSVVIGGNVQAIASQVSERVSMLVTSEVQDAGTSVLTGMKL